MGRKLTLNCGTCNCNFEYAQNEYKRQTKKGRSIFYCSLSCSGKRSKNVEHLKRNFTKYNLSLKGGENKRVSEDDFIRSSMREFLRRVRNRCKNKDKFVTSDLTIDDLKYLWNKQNGKCVYTKVDLILPSYKDYKTTNSNYKASLDRIDSSLGYTITNVQFISLTMNHLKSDMSESDVFKFIELIKQIK